MRLRSMKLFRVAGISLEIHPTFWLLPLFVGVMGYEDNGWAGAAEIWWALLLVYTCVVLHEFGHATAARALGVPVPKIVLLPIGGMALLGRMPRRPMAELLVVAAGPAVNFVIAGVAYALLGGWPADWETITPYPPGYTNILGFLLLSNLALGIFNLLPAFPMDGGRLLRALLATQMEYLNATWTAVMIGRVVAVLGIIYALFFHDPRLPTLAVLFAFVLLLGDMEYKFLRREDFEQQPAGVYGPLGHGPAFRDLRAAFGVPAPYFPPRALAPPPLLGAARDEVAPPPPIAPWPPQN